MKFDTKREAAQDWVKSFTRIPQSVIRKLWEANEDDFYEITPIKVGDTVSVYDNKYCYKDDGEVISIKDGILSVKLSDGEIIEEDESHFEAERDSYFPMWGTMWAFEENVDEEWFFGDIIGPHIQDMADCGFRIYESEDYGHVFGIDGAGYDFYEEHWIPLYEKRGLHWHKEEE